MRSFNEIVHYVHDEIQTSLDEIFGFQPQMKLNPSFIPTESDFICKADFIHKVDLFRRKTDLVEKRLVK